MLCPYKLYIPTDIHIGSNDKRIDLVSEPATFKKINFSPKHMILCHDGIPPASASAQRHTFHSFTPI